MAYLLKNMWDWHSYCSIYQTKFPLGGLKEKKPGSKFPWSLVDHMRQILCDCLKTFEGLENGINLLPEW